MITGSNLFSTHKNISFLLRVFAVCALKYLRIMCIWETTNIASSASDLRLVRHPPTLRPCPPPPPPLAFPNECSISPRSSLPGSGNPFYEEKGDGTLAAAFDGSRDSCFPHKEGGGETGGKSPGLPTPRNEKCPMYSEKKIPNWVFTTYGLLKKCLTHKKGASFQVLLHFYWQRKRPRVWKKCQILRERHFSLISDRGQPVAGKGVETLVMSPHTAETSILRSQTVFIQNWYIPVGNQPTSISWTVRRASPSFSSSAERSRTDSSTCGEKTPHFPLYFFLVKNKFSRTCSPGVEKAADLGSSSAAGPRWSTLDIRSLQGRPLSSSQETHFFLKKNYLDSWAIIRRLGQWTLKVNGVRKRRSILKLWTSTTKNWKWKWTRTERYFWLFWRSKNLSFCIILKNIFENPSKKWSISFCVPKEFFYPPTHKNWTEIAIFELWPLSCWTWTRTDP